jgi:hypothetical protein
MTDVSYRCLIANEEFLSKDLPGCCVENGSEGGRSGNKTSEEAV